MDREIRELERRVGEGSYEARLRWKALLCRLGSDPNTEELCAPLSEAEEIQEAYDDIWWHRRKALRLDWDGGPINNGGLYKAHHSWGHRGWSERNAKRKTLRTHRDGSRKNYRLRPRNMEDA